MIEISLCKGLRQQLREQGLKFKDGVNVSFFEEMLFCINYLCLYGYATRKEFEKIKNRFFKDLEKQLIKIKE